MLHPATTSRPDAGVRKQDSRSVNPDPNSGIGGSISPDPSGQSKLDILQQRMERVRAEKERLTKVGELEQMEAALQQEMMAELKKERGGA